MWFGKEEPWIRWRAKQVLEKRLTKDTRIRTKGVGKAAGYDLCVRSRAAYQQEQRCGGNCSGDTDGGLWTHSATIGIGCRNTRLMWKLEWWTQTTEHPQKCCRLTWVTFGYGMLCHRITRKREPSLITLKEGCTHDDRKKVSLVCAVKCFSFWCGGEIVLDFGNKKSLGDDGFLEVKVVFVRTIVMS